MTGCPRCSGLPAHRPPSVVGLVSAKWEHPPPPAAQRWIGQPSCIAAPSAVSTQHNVPSASWHHQDGPAEFPFSFFSFSRLDRDLEADIEPPCESHSAFLPLRRIQGKRLIRRIKVQPSSWTATWFHHQCPSVICQEDIGSRDQLSSPVLFGRNVIPLAETCH